MLTSIFEDLNNGGLRISPETIIPDNFSFDILSQDYIANSMGIKTNLILNCI